MLKKLINTLALGYLYYPHTMMLRMMGPRLARYFTRATARVHWWLTVLGMERRTTRLFSQLLPSICPDLNVRKQLQRHLLMKHQNFSEWAVYQTERGRRHVEQADWEIVGLQHLEAYASNNQGAILLTYHFGNAKMIVPLLKSRGYEIAIHRHVTSTYSSQTFAWMADAARKQSLRNEEQCGIKMFFHKPDCSFPTLLRYLHRGGVLSVNGDGMTGTDFLDVPFLGSTMSFPSGPVQLAAHAKVPIIPVFFVEDKRGNRKLLIHKPIGVEETSSEAIEQATRQCVGGLENSTRQDPWAWWTWRRLRISRDSEGASSLEAEHIDGNLSSILPAQNNKV